MGHELMRYLTRHTRCCASQEGRNDRESEGQGSSAGVQGGGPLASAERAPSPSVERWREFQREEENASQCMVLFLSLRIRRRLQRPRLATQESGIVHLGFPRPIGHQR